MCDDYQPIACGLHSEYELLAMHRAAIRLSIRDAAGGVEKIQGRVIDVKTRDKGEYMVLESIDGAQQREIRMDRIISIDRCP